MIYPPPVLSIFYIRYVHRPLAHIDFPQTMLAMPAGRPRTAVFASISLLPMLFWEASGGRGADAP